MTDDLAAMLADFGQRVECIGFPDTAGLLDRRIVTEDDVQRTALVLRVKAGAIGDPARDTPVWVDGVPHRIRERVDDAGIVDGAFDLFAVQPVPPS